MSKAEARKKSNDDLNNGILLNEVDAISKALYLDSNTSKSSASIAQNRSKTPGLRSKHVNDDSSAKDKKSFWNWKPLKALSHIRHRRFTCCFTLDVHMIEGLPAKFNGLGLSVHWKRRDEEVVTSLVKVVEGVAEYEEKLTHICSVYGSRSGPHHSAKYEAKHFLLYAALQRNPKLDLGKHRIDLTTLLPLTLEELEDEKNSGTWTTNFKLLGDAKGGLMHVSFGYLVVGDRPAPNNKTVLQLESKSTARSHVQSSLGDGKSLIRHAGTLPANHNSAMPSSSVRSSEFSSSVDVLYQKIDEEKAELLVDDKRAISVSADDFKSVEPPSCSPSYSSKENVVDENEDAAYSVIEKGAESLHEKWELNEDSAEVINESVMKSSDRALCLPSYSSKGNTVQKNEDVDFSVIEKGMESFEGKQDSNEDTAKVVVDQFGKRASVDIACGGAKDGFQDKTDLTNVVMIHGRKAEEQDMCTKESLLQDLESVLIHVANLEKVLDSSEAISELSDQENLNEDRPPKKTPSRNLDDFADSVADEFLDMLGIEESPFGFSSEAEPESPRERLLREFQKEVEASGCSMFGLDIQEGDDVDYVDEYVDDDDYYGPTISGWEEYSEDFDSYIGELEYPKIKAPCSLSGELEYPKIRAKVMEDFETQALMEEWGLNENAFQNSPPNHVGFDSPIKLPPEEPLPLPPLGEGLGPFIQTKSGGFLRSLNPALFKNAKSEGSLIMQVSSPVVVPSELGSGVMEIVQRLASVGLEKLSMQANKLMPLEDITGKTMQQVAWEAGPHLEFVGRTNSLHDEAESIPVASAGKKKGMTASVSRKAKKSSSSSTNDELDSDYVSLEDLAPLAMDKIEALSIEGLRIQSDMSDEEAPSNIGAQSIGEFSTLEGKRVISTGSMGLEGAAGLKLLDLKESGTSDIDGLMGLSLTLDEWMRLDSGEIDEEQMSERTSKLLAAHHANCADLSFLGKRGEEKHGKNHKRRGLLGNNFTAALMVQLLDPLRDYEPVGTPMLALIQVERVFLPPKPKIYCNVTPAKDTNDEDELEPVSREDIKGDQEEKSEEQDLIPQYRVTEVHVAGLKSEPGKKKLWGNTAQQQSGSRWLLANGMGKSNKHPFMKAKVNNAKSPLPATIKSQLGDTLWSISNKFRGIGAKWKEPAAPNPHIRNPNIILSDETNKMR